MTAKKIYILFFALLYLTMGGRAPAKAGGFMGFDITSADIRANEPVATRFTCDGEDISPELRWEGAPQGTLSLALIAEDPDAPGGIFIHWVVYDIPADITGFKRGASGAKALGEGAKEGVSSFGREGYNGPCPPPGHGEHRYYFRLTALDIERLAVKNRANKADVKAAMEGHVLAETSIMSTYSR